MRSESTVHSMGSVPHQSINGAIPTVAYHPETNPHAAGIDTILSHFRTILPNQKR